MCVLPAREPKGDNRLDIGAGHCRNRAFPRSRLTTPAAAARVCFGAATVAAVLVPARYVGRFRVSFDGRAVRAVSGVFVKKELFLPADAIRAFEVCSTPAQRLFGCRTIAIRFAGGAAFLPLLSKEQAEQLADALEELEE